MEKLTIETATERINMLEIVQQGGGWGPIECSVSIDSIGRNMAKCEEYTYFYKNKIIIIPLAMVDDLLAVAPCGLESTAINTRVGKNQGFFKKSPAQWGFLGFIGFFWVFLGFFICFRFKPCNFDKMALFFHFRFSARSVSLKFLI